jgi:hypothetical protein
MGLVKKILVFLKDFLVGLLYPALAAGFMLLIAAAMLYFQPADYLSDKALFPRNPQRPEAQLAWKLLRWGAELALASSLALGLAIKIESWWKKRPKKEPAPEPEAPKEGA